MPSSDLLASTASEDSTDEKARRAVKAFRALQPTLSAYARVLTKNTRVRVEMAARDNGSTDGSRIFFRPPIELGDGTPHQRRLCDKRDEHGSPLCPACLIRESVLTTIYHEIAHICYDSFAETTDEDKRIAVLDAVKHSGSRYAQKLEKQIDDAPRWAKNTYMGLANIISPFLPMLINCLEDARVNRELFTARKGTKIMFDADTKRIFDRGVEQKDADGNVIRKHWREYPLNAQAMCAVFCMASGYDFNGWFAPKVVEDLNDKTLIGLVRQIDSARSMQAVYALSFGVLERLRELGYCKADTDPEPDPEPKPEPKPEPEPENTDDDSEADDSESGDADDDAPGSNGDSDEEPGDEDSSDEERDGDGAGSDEPQDEAGTEDGDSGGSDEPGVSESGSDESDDSADDGTTDGPDTQSEADQGTSEEGAVDDEPTGDGSEGGSAGGSEASGDVSGYEPGDSSDGEMVDDDSAESDSQDEVADGPEQDGLGSGVEESGPESELPGEDDLDGSDSDDVPAEASGGESGTDEGDPSSDDVPGGSRVGGTGTDEVDVSDSTPSGDGAEDLHRGDEADSGDEASDSDSAGEPVSDPRGEGEPEEAPEVGDSDDVVDTGADRGEGGIEVIEDESNDDIPLGSPEDCSTAFAQLGEHDEAPKSIAEQKREKEEQNAVDTAILQGLYFETPSQNILGVREHYYGSPVEVSGYNMSRAWDHRDYLAMGLSPHSMGISGDFTTPEQILGPALLRMRVAFSDNKRGHDLRNMKSGKVDGRLLGKRAYHGDERLFRRRVLPGKKDYFVLIGMDVSGSTMGRNLLLEKKAVTAQAEMLARMGVRFAIYAHSGNYSDPSGGRGEGFDLDIYHVKDPTEPWDTKTQKRLEEIGPDSANLDGHTLEYYRRVCDRDTATDKVILYYTDGKMPAENHDEELEILQREIRTCRQKNYTLLGVGIRTDSPVRHGLDTVQVDEESDVVKVVKHLERRLLAR